MACCFCVFLSMRRGQLCYNKRKASFASQNKANAYEANLSPKNLSKCLRSKFFFEKLANAYEASFASQNFLGGMHEQART